MFLEPNEQSADIGIQVMFCAAQQYAGDHCCIAKKVQWNQSITTTSIIKCFTCDLFSDVF